MASAPFAKSIQLREWQDPVQGVVIHFSDRDCNVFFPCKDSDNIGLLTFERAWAIRSARTEVKPYYDRANNFHSYILQVFNSPWPKEIERGLFTDIVRTHLHKNALHYIVCGHDIYHEILCEGYSEKYIPKNDEALKYVAHQLGIEA